MSADRQGAEVTEVCEITELYMKIGRFISLVAPLTVWGSRLLMDHFLLVWWHRNTYTTFVAIVVLIAYPLSEHIRKVPEQMLSEEYQLQHRTIATAGSLSHPGSTTFFADLNPGLNAPTDTVPAAKYPQAITQCIRHTAGVWCRSRCRTASNF